ncbi:MAG: signal peptidase I, partial [Acidimicrobiales bacterium]
MDFTDSQGPADVGPADAGLADARPADARPADARPADAGQEASVGLAAFRRQRRRNKRARWAALNAAVLGAGVAVVLFLTQFGFQFYRVPSGSMEPTLVVGDRIWVQRVGLDTAKLHAGDIVVFRRPPADHVDTSISDVVK